MTACTACAAERSRRFSKSYASLNPANRSGGETAGGTDLIIPDIHLQWNRADRIIQQENCDRVWLLGDYFDDYGDTVAQAEQAREWLLGVC